MSLIAKWIKDAALSALDLGDESLHFVWPVCC